MSLKEVLIVVVPLWCFLFLIAMSLARMGARGESFEDTPDFPAPPGRDAGAGVPPTDPSTGPWLWPTGPSVPADHRGVMEKWGGE